MTIINTAITTVEGLLDSVVDGINYLQEERKVVLILIRLYPNINQLLTRILTIGRIVMIMREIKNFSS